MVFMRKLRREFSDILDPLKRRFNVEFVEVLLPVGEGMQYACPADADFEEMNRGLLELPSDYYPIEAVDAYMRKFGCEKLRLIRADRVVIAEEKEMMTFEEWRRKYLPRRERELLEEIMGVLLP